VLGNGFTVIPLGTGRFLIQSVPGQFYFDPQAKKTVIASLHTSNVKVFTFKLLIQSDPTSFILILPKIMIASLYALVVLIAQVRHKLYLRV
jgi:hypothetical protein